MTRKTLILVAGGALAATAVVGTAIGAGAAELGPGRAGSRPVAAITTDTEAPSTPGFGPTGAPGTGPTDVPTATPTSAPTATTPGTGTMGHAQAVEIALAQAGGGDIVEIDRDREHGRPVWSIEIRKGDMEIEIDVDAETGEIVKSEQERADDEDDDDNDHDDWDDN